MVLQRQSEVPIWGCGIPTRMIQVVGSWAPTDTVATVVESTGRWKLSLKTGKAGGPYTLTVICEKSICLQNVLLGEVWLCSGQSNMEWKAIYGLVNQKEEIANANDDNIRFLHFPMRSAEYPQSDCDVNWAVCTSSTMQNTSAVAYFFARKLRKELNVPVGLIVSAWGGTGAECWVPEDRIMTNSRLKDNMIKEINPWWPNKPGALYNQMIHPIVPFRIAGTLWYQGEANCNYPQTYGLLMKTLIESWRKDFGKNMPFYFVQIAPFRYNSKENGPALLREQQEFVSKLVPRTGMVVVSDLVTDINNIHPINKQDVGLRLARMVLTEIYGNEQSDYKSPTYKSAEIKGNKILISFYDAENGLVCKGKKVEGLQVEGADGRWISADGVLKGNTLVVSSRTVSHPQAVRYCFDDDSQGNLFTPGGLSVAPFRTDRWLTFE
jgi:sialate O-acetylesterase